MKGLGVGNNEETTEKKLGGCTGKGFMPGQSGNPSGRPKRKPIEEALLELIDQKPGPRCKDKTHARRLARAILNQAGKGYVKAFMVAADRIDGPVARDEEKQDTSITINAISLDVTNG